VLHLLQPTTKELPGGFRFNSINLLKISKHISYVSYVSEKHSRNFKKKFHFLVLPSTGNFIFYKNFIGFYSV
jgi:hypothetical protein